MIRNSNNKMTNCHKANHNKNTSKDPKAVKMYGQHFLIDQDILDEIVEEAELSTQDIVVEIGPGKGALTTRLCKQAGKVITFEIDLRMVEYLTETLNEYDNLAIYHEDILKMDLEEVFETVINDDKRRVKIIANIPYYITTPILEWIFKFEHLIDLAIIMVQFEVAQKIVAKPATDMYGVLSIKSQYTANVEKIIDVPKYCFDPVPEVDSAVVRFDMKHDYTIDKEDFFELVDASFKQRRKNLKNSFKSSVLFSKNPELILAMLDESEIDGLRRAESLSIEEFFQLFKAYKTVINQ